jgi:hypothetical protein
MGSSPPYYLSTGTSPYSKSKVVVNYIPTTDSSSTATKVSGSTLTDDSGSLSASSATSLSALPFYPGFPWRNVTSSKTAKLSSWAATGHSETKHRSSSHSVRLSTGVKSRSVVSMSRSKSVPTGTGPRSLPSPLVGTGKSSSRAKATGTGYTATKHNSSQRATTTAA